MKLAPLQLVTLILCVFANACRGADAPTDVAPLTSKASDLGLQYLGHQQNGDGSFGEDPDKLLLTSRALLVFLQAGNVADSGRYGWAVRSAEEWLIASLPPIGKVRDSSEHFRDQAAAVLSLSEALGVDANADRRQKIEAALKPMCMLLSASQLPAKGAATAQPVAGWTDERSTAPSVQITSLCTIALCAARDVGIEIPSATLESAARFIHACADGTSSGFGPEPGKPATLDSTAAAMTALDVLSPGGEDTARAIAGADRFFVAQAKQVGSLGYAGGAWLCWCDARVPTPAVQSLRMAYIRAIVARQEKDGAWNVGAKAEGPKPAKVAATELALIALSAADRVPPILKR